MAAFPSWFASMQKLKCTYKSKVFTISDLFVTEYLMQDGMNQPEKQDVSHLTPEL